MIVFGTSARSNADFGKSLADRTIIVYMKPISPKETRGPDSNL